MYADGELDTTNENLVMAFALKHPHLKDELDLLLECKLQSNDMPCFPKNKLLKPLQWDENNPETHQTQLLNLLDDELNATEKKQLLQAIATNNELAMDWAFLNEKTKLVVNDAIAFPKQKLLKNTAWQEETIEPIYSQMLLMLDGELPTDQATELLAEISANTNLKKEWDSLQLTKLEPYTINYNNKQALLKQTKTRKIGGWVQWAAAAVIIIGLITIATYKNEPEPQGVAPLATTSNKNETNDSYNRNQTIVAEKNIATNTLKPNMAATQATIATDMATNIAKQTTNAATRNAIAKNSMLNNEKNTITAETLTTNTIANNTEINNNNTLVESNEIVNNSLNNVGINTIAENIKTQNAIANTIDNNSSKMPEGNKIIPIGYNESNNYEVDDSQTIHVAGFDIKKQKIRGVFRGITRKLGRILSKSKIEETTNTEPNGITPKP
jgi:hypothetical protein